MILVVFRERYRPDADMEAYAALSRRMHELVERHPGFISIESFDAPDGGSVSLELFESEESVIAWRNHPEHREAQRRARDEFYEWYSVQVSVVERGYAFNSRISAAEQAV